MYKILSPEERIQLKNQHKREHDGRIRDRIKAVLLYDNGWTYQEIADVLLLNDETVRQHLQDYQACHKLKPENGGSQSKLNIEQTELLSLHLQAHTYLYAKDIVAYVKARFGIEYTVPGMTTWLHQHHFSYKKPAAVPGKANREAQEQWINEYKKKKENLPPNEAICFADGIHPTHNTKSAYGWIRKGERKEILTNTGRQRLNISGAIDINSKRVLVQQDSSLDAQSTITFLQKLEMAYPEVDRIHLFCDNARYYLDFVQNLPYRDRDRDRVRDRVQFTNIGNTLVHQHR